MLGHIAKIWRYPVKALKGEELAAVAVANDGLEGDRTAALFVDSAGHARTGNTFRGKEHNLLHLQSRADDAAQAARERGVAVHLREGERYFDAAPVSLLFDRWLEEAETLTGMRLDPRRFRPNFFIRAEPDFRLKELEFAGAELAIGECRLRVRKAIGRCVTITYDIASGESAPEVLRAVAAHRDNTMGIYCDVLQAGRITREDAVRLL